MVWVEIDGRKFLVKFDPDGEPLRAYERKGDPVRYAMYWHAKHHFVGSPKSVVFRVLEAAKAKHATP